jgi:hypothetical protein
MSATGKSDRIIRQVAVTLALLLQLAPVLAADDRFSVELSLPRRESPATVGDPVQVKVILSYPAGSQPPVLVRQFPQDMVLLDEEPGSPSRRDGMVTEERLLRFALFRTGEWEIGPLRYSTTGPGGENWESASAVVITSVESVIQEENPESAPPAPPWVIPYPMEKMILLITTLVALLAAAVLAGWYLRRRRRRTEVDRPVIPPHLEARQRLYALAARDLPAQGKVKPFYFLASEIIKDYLGKELGVLVLERTTAEITGQLPEVNGLGETNRLNIQDFLQASDLVKFAEYFPSDAEIEKWQRQAYDLIASVHEEISRRRRVIEPAAPEPPQEVMS